MSSVGLCMETWRACLLSMTCVRINDFVCTVSMFVLLCLSMIVCMIPINLCTGGGPRAAHGNHCRPAHQARQQLPRAQGGHQQRALHQGQGRQGQSGSLGRSTIAWIESNRIGSDRIGSDRIGSGRIGSDRIGSDRIGSDRIGSDRIGSDRNDSNRNDLEQNDRF